MTVIEKYGLKFVKIKLPSSHGIVPGINIESSNSDHTVLSFLNTLQESECKAFLYDMNWCLDRQSNGMGGFNSDGVEYLYNGIIYQYPNVIIDDILILSMQDMKEILEELLKYF